MESCHDMLWLLRATFFGTLRMQVHALLEGDGYRHLTSPVPFQVAQR